MSLAAYKVVLPFKGTQPGDITVERKAIVVASFDPADGSDPKARVDVTTVKKPRQEGQIPRDFLQALPEATSAHYLEEYLTTLSDSEETPPSVSPSSASGMPSASQTPPATPASPPVSAATASVHLFVESSVDGAPTLKPTVAFLDGGGKLNLIPVVGVYKHLPGPSLQRKARPEDPDIIDPYHVLGAGAFGISFKMGDTRKGEDDVALKATAAPRTQLERTMISNESYIPAAVRHPNVLPAAGPPMEEQVRYPLPPLPRHSDLLTVPRKCHAMHYITSRADLTCGDLDRVIRRHLRSPSADPAADRTERWWLLVDMVRGLAYLHGKPFEHNDRRVLHNDIKPANVLLRRDPATGRLMALLADLGMACEYTGGSANFVRPVGSRGAAPRQHPATDVYSMGVTLFCLYTQTDTYHKTEERPSEDELREAFAEVGVMEAAAGCPPVLVDLLVRMCSRDPTDRPSMKRVREAVEAVVVASEAAVRRKAAAEEEARLMAAAEEEARRKAAAEEARRKEEEARRKAAAEEEARRKAAAEEEARLMAAAEEEARRKAAAEEARRKEEEARRKAAAEEEARRKAAAEEEARRKAAAEEEARRKAAAEEEARRKAAAEEEARRKAAAEEARRKAAAEEEARRRPFRPLMEFATRVPTPMPGVTPQSVIAIALGDSTCSVSYCLPPFTERNLRHLCLGSSEESMIRTAIVIERSSGSVAGFGKFSHANWESEGKQGTFLHFENVSPASGAQTVMPVGGRPGDERPVDELFSLFLKAVSDAALAAVAQSTARPPCDVDRHQQLWVIAVPPHWSSVIRATVSEAALKAGLISKSNSDLVDWPDATAASYFFEKSYLMPAKCLVVGCDGGGTLDLTLLEVSEMRLSPRPLWIQTSVAFGATDADKNYLAFLRQLLGPDYPEMDAPHRAVLQSDCEFQKAQFDGNNRVRVSISALCEFVEPSQIDAAIWRFNEGPAFAPPGFCPWATVSPTTPHEPIRRLGFNLLLPAPLVMSFFEGTFARIAEQVAQMVPRRLQYIILVGDFSPLPLLHQYLREHVDSGGAQWVPLSRSPAPLSDGAVLLGLKMIQSQPTE
ncbi:putative choline-binding surface protein A [Paratrimastix pyriformis]|uniref:Choline-binding surface protein A n=1 Tax=Paratrimastix pyriformis TaxID=342808 RepID=A0ABQ8UF18_9EUKA|nr:putative choline-binding surface protein A [Paratrimastix pyriformis]